MRPFRRGDSVGESPRGGFSSAARRCTSSRSDDSVAVLGAILVVSGPTVVLPLLAFVRPTERVRSVLKWEGVAVTIGTGLIVGVLGAAVLWHLLRGLQRAAPGQGVAAALLVDVGALVVADLIREDSGFLPPR